MYDDAELIAGNLGPGRPHRHVPLPHAIGKTVAAIGETEVPGPHGPEPCVVLFFDDRTCHGFVVRTDDDIGG